MKDELWRREQKVAERLQSKIVMQKAIINQYRIILGFTEPWFAQDYEPIKSNELTDLWDKTKYLTDLWDINFTLERLAEIFDNTLRKLSTINLDKKDDIKAYIKMQEIEILKVLSH
jgi:hypothetical protein